jgi:Kef-type K+ transport system membrane component KefB
MFSHNHAVVMILPGFSPLFTDFLSHLNQPLSRLFLQITTIILLSQLLGLLLKKIRQPYVVGEIIAGIVLGPSLLGTVLPAVNQWLFPASSLPPLQFLSQMGLILFMFIIGMELNLRTIQQRAYSAVVISHTSIILPFLLGMALAYAFYEVYAPNGLRFLSFALFMGIAMSITAFPVLAKILQERGLTNTPLGHMAITCAAIDDVTAWCILAAVITIVQAKATAGLFLTFLLLVLYLLLMWFGVKPLFRWLYQYAAKETSFSRPTLGITIAVLLLSCYMTEIIGIHALFGAFLTGAIMPTNPEIRRSLKNKFEDVSVLMLLPVFFVLTGLRTKINLLDTAAMWFDTGLIILLAVAGKLGGSAVAARFTGNTWMDSLKVGVLMNTRGLMELIVLNIGYELGIISPTLFTMMVIMALSTTVMTGPALDLINVVFRTDNQTGLSDPPTSGPGNFKEGAHR